MVRGPDDIGVVLDGDDRPAERDEPLERREKVLDVGPVEAGRRLLQDVERGPGRGPPQLRGELHPLGLAAREGRRALAELEIAEAETLQDLQVGREARGAGEELRRLVDAHLQDVVDRLPPVPHGERLVVEAAALAVRADDVDVAQEMHADLEEPAPWHVSHRPPATLNENRPLPKPLARASGSAANRSRMRSEIFV